MSKTNQKEKQMPNSTKLNTVRQLLDNAQVSLKSAYSILAEISGEKSNPESPEIDIMPTNISEVVEKEEGKIIEGVFDGQTMIDAEGKKYPVPANYASKSKLVAGDILKLTIMPDGRFIYKQIGPVERKTVIGILNQEGSHFHVLANEKKFNVLLASVTYFKAKNGDEVTIIIPAKEETDWACIENVLTASNVM